MFKLERDCLAIGLPRAPRPPAGLTRRTFITGAIAGLVAGGTSSAYAEDAPVPQVDPNFWQRPRTLWLKRLATEDEVRVCYWANGQYLPDGYARLCWLLRDIREDQAVQMDTTLLNVLTGIQAYFSAFDVKGPIIVTSGYRTLATNERLLSEGAARNSMHLYGRAADITLPGVSVQKLGEVKRYLHAGGLGFYPSKHFIHCDTGRERVWRG